MPYYWVEFRWGESDRWDRFSARSDDANKVIDESGITWDLGHRFSSPRDASTAAKARSAMNGGVSYRVVDESGVVYSTWKKGGAVGVGREPESVQIHWRRKSYGGRFSTLPNPKYIKNSVEEALSRIAGWADYYDYEIRRIDDGEVVWSGDKTAAQEYDKEGRGTAYFAEYYDSAVKWKRFIAPTEVRVDGRTYRLDQAFSYEDQARAALLVRSTSNHRSAYRVVDGVGKRVGSYIKDGALHSAIEGVSDNEDNTPTQEERTSSMKLTSNLTVPRQTIIDKIKASLEASQAAWQAARDAEAAAVAGDVKKVQALLSAAPGLVITAIKGQYGTERFTKSEDPSAYVKSVKAGYGDGNGTPTEFVPSETATKLVAVLEAATDETLEISADDDLYKYL